MPQQRPTIKDIASAAGVSPQTVSRVLNNRPDVASDTRRRVKKMIDELDYRPSAVARSLVSRRSYTLGVVTAGLKYIGPSRTLHGIIEQAESQGYALLLKELPRFDAHEVKPLLDSLYAREVDGIIWAVPEIGNGRRLIHEHFSDSVIPVLFLARQFDPKLSIVAVDSHKGGRLATEHLVAQGRRHIGHISGPLDWWVARERKRGWQDAVAGAGLSDGDTNCSEGNWSAASGADAMRRLLATYGRMDAVFVANDQMALGALQAAHREGIRIPQDLAVVGFDNLPEAAYFWPPLTSIQQDQHELGSTAVQMVIKMIESGGPAETFLRSNPVVLQPELVIRESSQPSSSLSDHDGTGTK